MTLKHDTPTQAYAGVAAASAKASPVIECRSLWKIFGDHRIAPAVRKSILAGEIGVEEARCECDCVVAVQDISFSVSRGETFCVMGMSGSGKSTLIRHINRLIEPSSGDVLIDGQSVRRLNARELRVLRATRVGMVFQNMALLPHRTVESNAGLSLELRNIDYRERGEIVERVLEVVGLTGWGGCKLHELSGGMQQRVGLARALVADPEILLMDEPFSALDPLIRRQLQDEFKGLARNMGKTTVFITHDLDEAVRIGDRIAIMKDGRFVQVGTPAEILMHPADDFVASFVKGISRMHVVNADRLMVPVTAFQAETGFAADELETLKSARPDSLLRDLVEIAAEDQRPIAIRHDGRIVGVVSLRTLLEAMRGAD